VGDKQLTDFHLDVRHSVPACASREQFKGVLYGKGRAVFDGRILVEKQAQHSDAQLTNDNLMLTRNAEVDTKPQLEIYADDVKCSHGTTVGQLDPQQVFYLRSRGIDETAARKMLCIGFASEILDSIEVPALRDAATGKLHATLNAAVAAEG
jgi:Fe-S cluster assembly protein SufD